MALDLGGLIQWIADLPEDADRGMPVYLEVRGYTVALEGAVFENYEATHGDYVEEILLHG
jgi:hypothetical protein